MEHRLNAAIRVQIDSIAYVGEDPSNQFIRDGYYYAYKKATGQDFGSDTNKWLQWISVLEKKQGEEVFGKVLKEITEAVEEFVDTHEEKFLKTHFPDRIGRQDLEMNKYTM